MDLGLLFVRVGVGVAFAAQGVAKLRREGRAGTRAFLDSSGFAPAGLLVWATGLTELGAGILMVLGFLTPLATAGLVGVLLNAIVVARANGYWAVSNGVEYPSTLLVTVIGIAFAGAGGLSLDAVAGWETPAAGTSLAALALAVAASAPVLANRAVRLRRLVAAGSAPADVAVAA